ncbi:penicillin acylase family protein [Isosphaeraceae bacterium EP7]
MVLVALVLGLVVLVPALILLAAISIHLRLSLPRLDGSVTVIGLGRPLTIERDAMGVPTIRAESAMDAAYGLGFVHGQDRLFQMEALRRYASGRLSELFGPGEEGQLIDLDRRVRTLGLHGVATRAVSALPESQRERLRNYVDGVNAGVASLSAYPFEFGLLRSKPEAWKSEDSLLVVLALYLDLQGDNPPLESAVGLVHDLLPRGLAEFLTPEENPDWDAPLYGASSPVPPVPGPEVFDLRDRPEPSRDLISPNHIERLVAGSNAWAVAGSRSEHGGAIVANDMHLFLRVPNTWYRARIEWGDAQQEDGPRSAVGVSIPGGPGIVVGSNGDVAWGFTNTQGDWCDLVELEVDPGDPSRYRTPEGWAEFDRSEEIVRVKGGADLPLVVERTIWGPVFDVDHLGRKRVMRWTAFDPEGVHLGIMELAETRTLGDLLDRANLGGVPHLNCVAADGDGNVGWTVMGRIPRRVGLDGRRPTSWADGTRRWDGYFPAAENPRVVKPADGLIWNGNGRSVLGPDLSRVGHGPYDRGARGRQIRDSLLVLERATEQDMLNLQRDDRALFLGRWRTLMVETLNEPALSEDPRRSGPARLVEAWDGRATADSEGYGLVREFRLRVVRDSLSPLLAACRDADPGFRLTRLGTLEGPAWSLVTERPPHLLDPRFPSWDHFLLSILDEMIGGAADGRAQGRTWGEMNTLAIGHPLAAAIPLIGRFLNMPAVAMGGAWTDMPFIQGPDYGASERMVVSPGREDEGIFHMPCGQSGHPFSPFYRAGHDDWVRGLPSPLLPGPAEHTLRLIPDPASGPTS